MNKSFSKESFEDFSKHYLIIKVHFFLSSALAATWISYQIFSILSTTFLTFFEFFQSYFFMKKNGERGIWTLAPVTRPTPLAGAPLQPLEYFCWTLISPINTVFRSAWIIIIDLFLFVNHFFSFSTILFLLYFYQIITISTCSI